MNYKLNEKELKILEMAAENNLGKGYIRYNHF